MQKKRGVGNMNEKLIEEIRNMPSHIEKVSDITKKIIQDLKSQEFPIPIVKIMKELNFLVGTQELEDNLSGYIVIDNVVEKKFGKDRLICVNSKDSLGHQRFTIAHELAHFIFDYKPTENNLEYYNTYKTDDEDDEIERRANKFAANLLMPEDEFKRKYNELKNDDEKYIKLVEYFEVSRRAIDRRIVELGLN